MPHVIVKLWPGNSEDQKQALADAITRDVMDHIGCGEASVSVSVEEVDSARWREDVYLPDIREKPGNLYKKPGYSM